MPEQHRFVCCGLSAPAPFALLPWPLEPFMTPSYVFQNFLVIARLPRYARSFTHLDYGLPASNRTDDQHRNPPSVASS